MVPPPSHPAPRTDLERQVAIVLLPRFTLLVLGCIVDALRLANRAAGRGLYAWTIVGLQSTVVTSSHVSLSADRTIAEIADLAPDIVIVCGGLEGHRHADRRVSAWLRELDLRGAITSAVSTGVWSLAHAGLLDGRRCAVHWDEIPTFAARFPLADVQREIFAQDGRRMTCSGGVAVVDMMLHLIAMQHGRAIGDEVADLMIHARIRTGTDKQRRSERSGGATVGVARRAIAVMEEHIETVLPIDDVAARVGQSTRQLERLFARVFGMPPKQFSAQFRKAFGTSPNQQRRNER
jgi:transcriptional regulator GlxA family with amidase domain